LSGDSTEKMCYPSSDREHADEYISPEKKHKP
jgi:hypothetical protein